MMLQQKLWSNFDSTRQIKAKVNAMNDKLSKTRAPRTTGKLPD